MDVPTRYPAVALAAVSLSAGIAVYALARPASLFAMAAPQAFAAWTAALPSLLHTFGFALLGAATLATRRQAIRFVAAWGLIELLAELGQRVPPTRFVVPLPRGTFDALDLFAIALATALAVAIVRSWWPSQ